MFTSASYKATVALIFLLVLMTVVQGTTPSKGVLKGTVVDSFEHARINRVFILVHKEYSQGGDDEKLSVDNEGSFSIELAPGFYDVFVSAPQFSPACAQFAVEAGKTVVYHAELKMSELENTPD